MKSIFKQNIIKVVFKFGFPPHDRFGMLFGMPKPHVYPYEGLAGVETFYETDKFPELEVGQNVYIDGCVHKIERKATAEEDTIIYFTNNKQYEIDEESKSKATEEENKWLKEQASKQETKQEEPAKITVIECRPKNWWQKLFGC